MTTPPHGSDLALMVERAAEHGRMYADIQVDTTWLYEHIEQKLTGRKVSSLPRREPMVAAAPSRHSNRPDMNTDTPSPIKPRSRPVDTPPPPPQPPPRRSWIYRNGISICCAVVVIITLAVLYLNGLTGLTFIIMFPVLVTGAVQRHLYRHRIEELAMSVVREASYIRSYFPARYPSYLEEAAEALRERGAGKYVTLLPSR